MVEVGRRVLFMKKKTIIILITVALVLLGVMIMMLINLNKSSKISEFDLSNYKWEIETFQSDKNVGKVNDSNTAIAQAKELWIEKYGTINGIPYDPTHGRKVNVYFDYSNDCWLIRGTLPPNTKGSVPSAIIQKDGTVLAVWMD